MLTFKDNFYRYFREGADEVHDRVAKPNIERKNIPFLVSGSHMMRNAQFMLLKDVFQFSLACICPLTLSVESKNIC